LRRSLTIITASFKSGTMVAELPLCFDDQPD
jgi:hypothetical protein